jgi:hypothetical protein
MNEGNCLNCVNSPWVQRANRFINRNRRNQNYNAHVSTIEFLLQHGHCGIRQRTGINSILRHLGLLNIHMSREDFQQNVLTTLKRQGMVATLIYSGRLGGVFIPCDQIDIRQVAEQVIERVTQELRNLEGITNGTQIHNLIERLRQNAERVNEQIETL